MNNFDPALFSDSPPPALKADLFSEEPAPKIAELNKIASPAYNPNAVEEERQAGSNIQDTTVPDAMMAQGAFGLAKAGLGTGVRAIGAGLEALPATKNLVPTIEDMSNDLLLRSMGARSGQIRNLADSAVPGSGLQAARNAASLGREAGVGRVFSTQKGRLEDLQNLIQEHGENIGKLRTEAGTASPDIYEQVAQDVGKKYSPENKDLLSPQARKIPQSINTVQNAAVQAGENPLSHKGVATGLTDLNEFIRGESLRRPTGAMADTASKLGDINNQQIAQSLGPDKAAEYLNALEKESGAFHLKPLMERGAERQSVGAMGGGGPLSLIHRGINNSVFRMGSTGLDALHSALANGADLSTLPPAAAKALLGYLAEDQDANR